MQAAEPVVLEPLERAYLGVMRLRAGLTWGVLALLAAAGDAALVWRLGTVPGLLTGPVLLLGVVAALVLAPRRWSRWRHAFTGAELHVARGWLFRLHTVVPVVRVQHIDISQGPLERGAGVATLRVHTAGTEHSLVVLPGLALPRAEAIRDAIRAQIRDTAG
jgi:membrane protein YdbS with pleckstrin-like domain